MSAYLSAALIVAASLVVGAALTGGPRRPSWTAPAVGASALMLLALLTIRLPGHGQTAAVFCVVAIVISVAVLLRRRETLAWALLAVPVALVVGLLCSLPFIANDRIGILGVSVLDDLASHVGQAEAMRVLGAGADVASDGYPTGPHALVATVSEGTAIGIPSAFTGLLLATPVLTALTALAALGAERRALRVLGASVAGASYLPVSYMAQGAFKEPLLALFALGFVLLLREARQEGRVGVGQGASLLLTAAGGVAAFGVLALAWPALSLVWLGMFELTERGGWGRLVPRRGHVALVACVFAFGAAGVAVATTTSFFESGPGQYLTDSGVGGNYVGQISPFEALGAWPERDFRFSPDVDLMLVLGVALALALLLHGIVWCWRNGERTLLAGTLAAVSIYVAVRPFTLAYFSGKALVAAAPLVALTILGPLLSTRPGERVAGRRLAIAAFATYLGMAAYSSALTLRWAQVRPAERGSDLERFGAAVRDEPILYLGRDDWAPWELRGAQLWGFQRSRSGSATSLSARPAKTEGDSDPPAVDVDSVDAGTLDGYRYLVTSRTDYASIPPANFRLVERTRWHLLWERRGKTSPRWTLDEGEAPGAVLVCRTPKGRFLSRQPGRAMVRPRPLLGRAGDWKTPAGDRVGGPGAVGSEGRLQQRLHLTPGTWELSLRWFSSVPLEVRAGALRRTLPAYLSDRSTFARVGVLRGHDRPVTIEVEVPKRRRIALNRTALIGSVVATRIDAAPRLIPLARACGRYVDFILSRGTR